MRKRPNQSIILSLCQLFLDYPLLGSLDRSRTVADFFLLTKHAGLNITKALALNFLTGLSIVLGGIVVVAVDVSDLAIGVI